MRRIAIPGFFVATVLAFLLPLLIPAQSHSGFPVNVVAGPPPQPVVADGRIQLNYELQLANFAPLPIELTAIDVPGGGATSLGSYRGEALEKIVIPPNPRKSPSSIAANSPSTTRLSPFREAMQFHRPTRPEVDCPFPPSKLISSRGERHRRSDRAGAPASRSSSQSATRCVSNRAGTKRMGIA